ncbi:MAG: hypothetical protein Solumvirus3_2 [Solumvirus sp.]|uniref:Uncharacterized protein n=1 Tax=Solumvirus sp. TaxID=2487773 RepID=A0A3G5AGB6_9VIRU|nr:MAG: hypothetical protein Solumvirus3_2 [Solumvirus sp.]
MSTTVISGVPQTLAGLNPGLGPVVVSQTPQSSTNWLSALVGFIILVIIIWIIIYAVKPSWAQVAGSDKLDTGKALWAAIIIAIIIMIIIWLIKSFSSKQM